MKKHEVYIGKVKSIDFPNRGMVEVEGEDKLVMVKNALPGETIKFRLTKNRQELGQGNFINVEEKSPFEVNTPCPNFRKCGGCLYSGFEYNKHLEIKESQVKNLLADYINDEVWQGAIPSPVMDSYRNKMELSFGDEFLDGPLSLGMHKRASHYDIVTVDDCKLMSSDFKKILRFTLDYFTDKKVPFYRTNKHVGYLRNLLLREGKKTGEILIDLVTSTDINSLGEDNKEDYLLDEYKSGLLSLELDNNIVGILHTHNDSLADIVQDDGTDILYGRDYFYENLFELKFKITPFSFFQTNTSGAEKLYSKVREYIGDIKGKVVYDLYCGTGTITQLMGAVADKVIGVEIVEEAVEAAKINTNLNGLDNCDYIAGDVLKVVDLFSGEDSLYPKPDTIILDPPRDGIHPKALPKIIDFNVDEIVYVSCKPTSLARDMEILDVAGYKIKKGCCVDMFPWTGNIETVCLLVNQNAKAKQHVNVGIDAEEYYRIKNS